MERVVYVSPISAIYSLTTSVTKTIINDVSDYVEYVDENPEEALALMKCGFVDELKSNIGIIGRAIGMDIPDDAIRTVAECLYEAGLEGSPETDVKKGFDDGVGIILKSDGTEQPPVNMGTLFKPI